MSEPVGYLRARLCRVYDGLGNGVRTPWTLRDATAVRELLDAVDLFAANSDPHAAQLLKPERTLARQQEPDTEVNST